VDRSWTPDAFDVRNQGSKPSRTPLTSWVAIGTIFIILGISAVFTSGLAWLGGIVCGLGLFWMFLGWRYARR
jgi:Flp pilus assembly protein TadB